MARVKDLWWTTGSRGPKRKTARHPDRGGDPNAKRYLAVWQDPSGRERTQAFSNKKKAAEHGTAQEEDARRGEYIDGAAAAAQVRVFWNKWIRLREVSAGTVKRYRSCYGAHIDGEFGGRPAGEVKPTEVAAWSRSLADHPATRHLALLILSGVFDLAVADKARRDNPVQSQIVGRPKRSPRAKEDPWDAARILGVAVSCHPHSHVPLLGAALGLRQGEIFGLALADFDEGEETAVIGRQLARHDGKPVFKLPKGGKTREVPVSPGTLALAQSLPGVSVTLPWLKEDGTFAVRPVTAVLLCGEPMSSQGWERQVWKPALAAAGVIPAYTGRGYTADRKHGMHVLRHWFSTWLLDNGVSVAAVMEFMGHSRKSMPIAVGVYGQVTPEAFELARQAVDRALFKPFAVQDHGTVTELRATRLPH